MKNPAKVLLIALWLVLLIGLVATRNTTAAPPASKQFEFKTIVLGFCQNPLDGKFALCSLDSFEAVDIDARLTDLSAQGWNLESATPFGTPGGAFHNAQLGPGGVLYTLKREIQ